MKRLIFLLLASSGYSTIYSQSFTKDGYIGVGINTPLAPLHIKKDLEALRIEGNSPYLSFYSNAGTVPKAFMQNTGDHLYLGTSTGNINGNLQVYLNSSPRLTILPSGNIGIGTTTPTDKFSVHTAGYGITQTLGPATVGTWIGSFQGVYSAMIGTKTNHSLHFFTNTPISRVTLATNGNFGIGTQTPTEKLTVQTTNNSDGISHKGDGDNVLKTRMGGTSAGIGTFSNTHMRIFCNSRSDLFISSATGNVGIGTENFGPYKLAVLGKIRSNEIVVENGWADYVFNENYQLLPLEQVEEFIQKNKHLPNIPSAKEVSENGLNLGDTQKRMMEKIEELTLYIIEMKKEITSLTNQVTAVKKLNQ